MKRIVVGITGASGAIYGIRLLEALRGKVETYLVLSNMGRTVLEVETIYTVHQVQQLATKSFKPDDMTAPIASGSFCADGMVVLPCSMKSLSAIAHSYTDNVLTRAADVMLKERRTLVLGVRESPFHRGHIKSMAEVTEMGGIICPPIPAFYNQPVTIEDIINHSVGKILDILHIEHTLSTRWNGVNTIETNTITT